jgi:hypothetical protein
VLQATAGASSFNRFIEKGQFWYIIRSHPEETILKSDEVLNGYIFFGELASSLLQHKKNHRRRAGLA